MFINPKLTRVLSLLGAGLFAACAAPSEENPSPALDAGLASMDAAVDHTCPPAPPFGIRKGKSVQNVILEDCDGNTYQIHGLCGNRASWFFVHAEW